MALRMTEDAAKPYLFNIAVRGGVDAGGQKELSLKAITKWPKTAKLSRLDASEQFRVSTWITLRMLIEESVVRAMAEAWASSTELGPGEWLDKLSTFHRRNNRAVDFVIHYVLDTLSPTFRLPSWSLS